MAAAPDDFLERNDGHGGPPTDGSPLAERAVPVAVSYGDGIGPEIMAASTRHPGRRRRADRSAADRDRREGVPRRAQRRNRRGLVGHAAADPRPAQGAGHHAVWRRVQEPERHAAQDAGVVRERAAVRRVLTVRGDAAPGDGRGDHPRERGRPLRGDRAPADRRGLPVPQADHPAGLRADRPLRVRVRAQPRSPPRHMHGERQHHEDDGRPVLPGLPGDRRVVSGHRAGSLHHRHRRGTARDSSRSAST